jgi:hypothetical protein
MPGSILVRGLFFGFVLLVVSMTGLKVSHEMIIHNAIFVTLASMGWL